MNCAEAGSQSQALAGQARAHAGVGDPSGSPSHRETGSDKARLRRDGSSSSTVVLHEAPAVKRSQRKPTCGSDCACPVFWRPSRCWQRAPSASTDPSPRIEEMRTGSSTEISSWRRPGTIFDARGRALAVSLKVPSVFADPSEVRDTPRWPQRRANSQDVRGSAVAQVKDRSRRFVWLRRKVDPGWPAGQIGPAHGCM